MITFTKVSLEHRSIIQQYTLESPYSNCDYSFANLYNWREYYDTCFAIHKEMLIIRFEPKEGGRPACLMPIGNGSLEEVLTDLNQHFRDNGHTLTLMAVTDEGVELLRRTCCDHIHLVSDRSYTDYIYLREKLVTLSGKKLQSKRNHINRFKSQYPNYTYEELSRDNAAECFALEERWYATQDEYSEDVIAEKAMVQRALNHFEEIGMKGGVIRVEGTVVAFTMGMPINDNTFGINIEKADTNYDGAFTIINQEFASRIPEQYTYINREEDLGIEGLRQAKLSYKPEILLNKQTVLMRCE